MAKWKGPPGEMLLAAALILAAWLAQNRTVDEIELMSAFFDVLADNLGLIAAGDPCPTEAR